MPRGSGVSGHALDSGQPLVFRTTPAGRIAPRLFASLPIKAVMVVPLRGGGRVVGTIGMSTGADSDRMLGEPEVDLLSRFAQLASLALDNARLFAQTQQQARRLTLLSQMAEELNRTTDLGRIFDVAAEKLNSILHVDEAYLYLVEAERASVRIVTLHGEAAPGPPGLPGARPFEVVPYEPGLLEGTGPVVTAQGHGPEPAPRRTGPSRRCR